MPDEISSIVKKPLWKWVISKKTIWLQVLLVFVAVLSALANLLPLDMQKRIVNEAIAEKRFDLLVKYCSVYLAAVLATTLLKYLISALQNIIGQKCTRDMRNSLYRHIISRPLDFFRDTQPGLVISALTTEIATAGSFVGMSVAVPVTNLFMLIAFTLYLFSLNSLLAAISFSIYPIILLIIPVLQKQVNRYNRMRIDATRKMSGKAGETISGVHEIHANNTFEKENNAFESLVKALFKIRIIWFLYRQAMKRANSLIVNFSRFLVFAVGGWLTINNRLDLGALVAFISAQDKLYDPWKELIAYYQARETAYVTYDRTMEYFDIPSDIPQKMYKDIPSRLKGDIVVKHLDFVTQEGVQLLNDINLELHHGEHMAVVGYSGSGKSTLVKCIAQLYPYTSGEVQIDNKEVARLSKNDIANTIGFVSQEPFVFDGTIQENLLYASLEKEKTENSDVQNSAKNLDDQILALQQSGLFIDVLGFGLKTTLDEKKHEHLVASILDLRKSINREYKEELSDIIEFYNPNEYLYYSSIAENLLFGETASESMKLETLLKHNSFIDLLVKTSLLTPLIELGITLISKVLERYDRDSINANGTRQETLIPADEIDEYKTILYKTKNTAPEKISGKMRQKILQTVFNFVAKRDDFIDFPDRLASQIVQKRPDFKKKVSFIGECKIKDCDPSEYLYSRSILTNIFYGKIKENSSDAQEKIDKIISRLLIKKELLEIIVDVGLRYKVGNNGKNLSGGQNQKLAIARILFKNPPVLIMDEATSGLDNKSQERIQKLLETQWKKKSSLLAVVHRLDIIKNYDQIIVMKSGKIVEAGAYNDLMEKKGVLFNLVNTKK